MKVIKKIIARNGDHTQWGTGLQDQ